MCILEFVGEFEGAWSCRRIFIICGAANRKSQRFDESLGTRRGHCQPVISEWPRLVTVDLA